MTFMNWRVCDIETPVAGSLGNYQEPRHRKTGLVRRIPQHKVEMTILDAHIQMTNIEVAVFFAK